MAVLDVFDPFPEDDFFDPGYDADGDHEGGREGDSVRDLSVRDLDGGSTATSGAAASGTATLTLAEIAERIRPTVLAAEQTLAVPEALSELFPLGGIVRGSRVSLRGAGATSLCMAMLAEASQQGSWIAVVGVAPFGWAAAVRSGWNLQRCVFVDEPPAAQWGTVLAALVDALDIVVTDPAQQVGAAEARRLAARSRERGSVIVDLALGRTLGGGPAPGDPVPGGPVLGDEAQRADKRTSAGRSRSRWPIESDLTLTAHTNGWAGLGVGEGLLGERDLRVEAIGRRGAGRPRAVDLTVGVDGSLFRREPADAVGVERRHLRSVG
ncbi:MAG: hypothetical protein GX868_15965 [Actinobacteria bacterium]|nr:hypothetical protein [Actinomycetota bacterium]